MVLLEELMTGVLLPHPRRVVRPSCPPPRAQYAGSNQGWYHRHLIGAGSLFCGDSGHITFFFGSMVAFSHSPPPPPRTALTMADQPYSVFPLGKWRSCSPSASWNS